MHDRPDKSCYQSALRLLARRDHSCGELRRKLRQKRFSENDVESAIAECRRLGYLEDERFARIYCKQLQRRGYGRRHIRHMLRLKHVAGRITAAVIEHQCNDDQEAHHCRRTLEKKMRSTRYEGRRRDLKTKAYRFLLGRGYTPAVIQRVVGEVMG